MKKLLINEIKSYIREPFALFFTVFLPIGLTFVYGQAFGKFTYEDKYTGYDLSLIFNLIFLMSNLGLMGLVNSIVEKKATFTYKRYSVLPLRKMDNFILSSFSTITIACIVSAAVILLNYTLYNLTIKINPVFILIIIVEMYLFFGIGYIIATLNLSPKTGQAMGIFTFFIILFFSGVMIPIDDLSPIFQKIAKYSPMNFSVKLFLFSNDYQNFMNYKFELSVVSAYVVAITVLILLRRKDQWS